MNIIKPKTSAVSNTTLGEAIDKEYSGWKKSAVMTAAGAVVGGTLGHLSATKNIAEMKRLQKQYSEGKSNVAQRITEIADMKAKSGLSHKDQNLIKTLTSKIRKLESRGVYKDHELVTLETLKIQEEALRLLEAANSTISVQTALLQLQHLAESIEEKALKRGRKKAKGVRSDRTDVEGKLKLSPEGDNYIQSRIRGNKDHAKLGQNANRQKSKRNWKIGGGALAGAGAGFAASRQYSDGEESSIADYYAGDLSSKDISSITSKVKGSIKQNAKPSTQSIDATHVGKKKATKSVLSSLVGASGGVILSTVLLRNKVKQLAKLVATKNKTQEQLTEISSLKRKINLIKVGSAVAGAGVGYGLNKKYS